MKPNKHDVNYLLPDDCCATCVHSFQSIYGDYQCTELEVGNTIDAGGLCDLYIEAITVTEIPDIRPTIEIEEQVVEVNKDCIHCTYSYLKDNIPICGLDQEPIADVTIGCNGFNKEIEG